VNAHPIRKGFGDFIHRFRGSFKPFAAKVKYGLNFCYRVPAQRHGSAIQPAYEISGLNVRDKITHANAKSFGNPHESLHAGRLLPALKLTNINWMQVRLFSKSFLG